MILRLSQKLCTKINAGSLKTMPLDANPFADWSSHLFVADRTQYIITTNTKSLYSTVAFGKGIRSGSELIERALGNLREFMQDDGQQFIYQRFIAPASSTVCFAKALDRSVTGSINDLVLHAKMWLIEGELSPYDVGFKLNEIPFSSLKYANPKEAFKAMHVAEPDKEGGDE